MNNDRILCPEELVVRTADEIAIKNIMGKYTYWLFAREYDRISELFAQKTEGTRAQIANWGIYRGTQGVRRLFSGVMKYIDGGVGCFYCDPITTPCIEVAGDGKTAKGLWIVTGAETTREADGNHQAYWSWARYAVDFVKEDGSWRIWHFNLIGLFRTRFGVTWVGAPENWRPELPDELKPDDESGYTWYYRTDVKTENIPAPPDPYWTFDETFSY